MKCPSCGKEILKTDKFCKWCGSALMRQQNKNIEIIYKKHLKHYINYEINLIIEKEEKLIILLSDFINKKEIVLLELDEDGIQLNEKKINFSDNFEFIDSIQTKNGIIICFKNENQLHLRKIDEYFNKIWEKSFNFFYPFSFDLLTTTNDNGFIIGINLNNKNYSRITKIDKYGYIVWSKQFEIENIYDITQINNTFFLRTTKYILNLDKNGEIIWKKQYLGKHITKIFKIDNEIFAILDEDFIISTPYDIKKGFYLTKIDKNGLQEWEIYTGINSWYKNNLIKINKNKYLIYGIDSYTDKLKLININDNGKIIWSKLLNLKRTNSPIVTQINNEFIITYNKENFSLMKIDENGNKKWEKLFQRELIFNNIFKTKNNNFIINGIFDRELGIPWIMKLKIQG